MPVLLTLLLSACAINPVTGQQELMLLSEADERQLGSQTDLSVVEQYGFYPDGALNSYVDSLGQQMARLSHRPQLDWSFKVMDSPVVNAFAAPGGYIYVTRGLLAAVNDEAELAGVLGHEIAHVTARHSARRYSQTLLTSLGVGLGVSLAGDYGDVIEPLLQVGTGLLFLKYSRDDERQADALAVEYASKAGFDAGQLANFFDSLERMNAREGEGGRLPEFFSTHPSPENRQASVRQMAADWQRRLPERTLRRDHKGYLQRINGLVYGDDPRKGFREGDWYYLPEPGVQFRIPDEWSFDRSALQARMAAADKKALVLFEVKEGTGLDAALSEFVEGMQAKVLKSTTGTRAGLPSRQVISQVSDQQRTIRIQSDFILGQGQIFVFHGLAEDAEFPSRHALLAGPAASFAKIADQNKRERQPRRIQIKAAPQSTSMQAFLRAQGVDKELWQEVAWLNGKQLTDQVAVGEWLKVAK
ncbi:MAG: M48 family metalloprotease [Desulfuromonadales bacterium]|nr:M48 family metalloprotease [Desulfuromonadales bacterium]